MKFSGVSMVGNARSWRLIAPRLAMVALVLVVVTASPAGAGVEQDSAGNSGDGFGWSLLIPVGVLGLVVLGALLATRVGRSEGLDPEQLDADPIGTTTETDEDPTI